MNQILRLPGGRDGQRDSQLVGVSEDIDFYNLEVPH